MVRFFLVALALVVLVLPAQANGLTGQYVEARTCDVWTGPCFANADFNLSGKHAVLGWRVERGNVGDVSLDGLGVVAVIIANNTLGLEQTGPARSLLIVDQRATPAQRQALIKMAHQQAGKLLDNVVGVHNAEVNLNICACKNETCAELVAGGARLKTRCLDSDHDKVCGNESAFYPPLAQGVQVRPGGVIEHSYTGTGLNETWRDFERRAAYVGSFAVR